MTKTTRRALLAAGAVGAALTPLLLAPDVYAAATTRRDLYTRSRFRAMQRKTFRLEGPTRHWRVRLTAVRNLPNCAKRNPHAFSLTFRSGAAGPESGSYVLRRPGFKATTLFLVPSDAGRRTYEAVIFRKP
ncbi:MAG TPA: hypothetical protein VFI19_06495 [Nocardioides sp.]|nr:hypothetical protein [Nocardioides sp.]